MLISLAATSEIFKYHSRLSNNLHLEVLNLLQQYLVTCKTTVNEPQATIAPAVIVDEDSQDYFDDADGDLSGYEEAIKLAEMKQAAEVSPPTPLSS